MKNIYLNALIHFRLHSTFSLDQLKLGLRAARAVLLKHTPDDVAPLLQTPVASYCLREKSSVS